MDLNSVWTTAPKFIIKRQGMRPTSAPSANSGDSETMKNVQQRVRCTWTGPIDPQMYGDGLKTLVKNTERNLSRLQKKRNELQTNQQSLINPPSELSLVQSPWHDSSVMFAPWSTLSQPSSIADDESSFDGSIKGNSTGANFCYLCTTLEEHQMHLLRTRIPKKSVVRKPRVIYEAPKPKVKRKIEEPKEHLDWRYKVVVWTADIPGATTDANVFISLKGDLNFLYKAGLTKGSNKFCFCRGSKETFFVKSHHLGNLEILSIEHDGLEKRHSWYCDKIEVTCMKTQESWLFTCKNWLSLHHGDYAIRRDIYANHVQKISNEFELTVITGQKRMAGTDANVFVTFHGTKGNSPKIKLSADGKKQIKNLFEKGSEDKFHLKIKDLGEIKSLRVEHDGKGIASGWFLDKIILQNINNPKVIYYFLLNGWIAKDVGDGHLWREIKAKKKLLQELTSGYERELYKASKGKPVSYQVTVRTGDVRYAGTDANVYIIIHGKKGKTKKLFMDDSKNNFERGATEIFELTAFDVGEIARIDIGHDSTGPGAGWYCEDIKIKKYLSRENVVEFLKKLKKKSKTKKTQKKYPSGAKRLERQLSTIDESDEDSDSSSEGSYRNVFDRDGKVVKVPVYQEFYFVCKNWLAKDEADGLIERELEVKSQSTYFQEKELQDR